MKEIKKVFVRTLRKEQTKTENSPPPLPLGEGRKEEAIVKDKTG